MTTQNKKRGRPKTERTIERERIEEMLRNPPPHIRNSTLTPFPFDHEQAEEIEKQMLKDHKSPPMPAKIVYEIESSGPENMTHAEIQATVAEYDRIAKNIHQGQITGGKTQADKAAKRIEQVMRKNSDVIGKLASGSWSVSRAANKIHDEWDARGDGQKKPSTRQLRRWLKMG
jgi:hypothetical protein